MKTQKTLTSISDTGTVSACEVQKWSSFPSDTKGY